MSRLKQIGDWFEQRLQIAGAIRETADASGAPPIGELVVRLRQRCADRLHPAGLHRHHAGADLRAFGRRSLEQPAISQPRCHPGMVPARGAWLGLQLHGRARAHPHGAGVSVRRLQVSPRADLDLGRISAADDAGHGLHRPGSALRSGCLLGSRHRSRHHGPCSAARRRASCICCWAVPLSPAIRCRDSSRCTCSSFPACSSASSACTCSWC